MRRGRSAIARERALVSTLPFALQAQARALIGASQFDLAYSAAEEGWRLALDVQQPWAASLNLAYLARIDALRGAEQLASERVSELQALVATSGASALTCSVAMTMGLLELERGRPSQALDHLMVVVSTVRPESNPLFVLGLPDAVEAAVRADRLDDVLGDFERFEAWVTEFPTPARVALLARCRALVDESAAERNFEQSVGLAETLSPFDRARSEMLYGEWLRRHRRQGRRPSTSARRATGIRPARPPAVGGTRSLGAARNRRDRAQARPLHP